MRWKMIYLARRNPALAAEEFPQAWREHSALGRQCRNVQDKVLDVAQCSRLLNLQLAGGSDDYDGVNLLGLRDRQAASDIWNDPETLAIMRPDEARVFSTHVRNFTLVCSERVLRDAPRTGCALFAFLRRNPRLGPDAFAHAWLDDAGHRLDAFAPVTATRVVHNLVEESPPAGYEYDGIAEWWFESPAALQSTFAGAGIVAGLPAACADLIDSGRSVFVATHVTHQRP